VTHNTEDVWGRMSHIEDKLDRLVEGVGEVKERLARIEGSAVLSSIDDLKSAVSALQTRQIILETEDAARNAASAASSDTLGSVALWLYKLAPWLFATALVVFSNWVQLK
jgi:hypothetical protein